jgi:DNA-directed RNA polymerase delta subunit
MNYNKYDSLLEIATCLMKSKRKPKSLKELTNEVFQAKGIKDDKDIGEKKAQFQVDFMVSGNFVCCGENKQGYKLWDLKSRQPSTLLDKDGNYLEDLYADDEDVIKNELKDDFAYSSDLDKNLDSFIEDDEEDDDDTEKDDIEEELGLVGAGEDVEETDEPTTTEIVIDDEDDEEGETEELDDIEKELIE